MHNHFKSLAGTKPVLVGLNVYLIFTLNFLGIFGHGLPHRKINTQFKQQDFRVPGVHTEKKSYPSSAFLRRSVQFSPSPQDQFDSQTGRRSTVWANHPSDGDTIDLSTVEIREPVPSSIQHRNAFNQHNHREYRPPPQRPSRPRLRSKPPRSRWREQLLRPRIQNPRQPARHPNHNYNNGPPPGWPPRGPPPPQYPQPPDHFETSGALASTFAQPQTERPGILGSVFQLIKGPKKPENNFLESELGSYDYDATEYEQDYFDESVIQQYNQRRKTVSERVADWFKGFQPDQGVAASKPGSQTKNGIDYNDYDAGDDFNLVFYNKTGGGGLGLGTSDAEFGFEDVLQSIRRNESSVIIMKKFLSAASALSERSGNNPVFMMWTIPTTIFAILGLLYLGGAMLILTYKGLLFATGNTSDLVNVLPVAFSFGLPLVLGLVLVGMKTYAVGQVSVARVMRGDIKNGFREDFDPIHFGLDSAFGASALLGLGWIISIAV